MLKVWAVNCQATVLDDGYLDTHLITRYNILCAEVAQAVEQRTENPRVPSSILGLGTISLVPKWRNGRRGSLKNCWRATSVSVRLRPSADKKKPHFHPSIECRVV